MEMHVRKIIDKMLGYQIIDKDRYDEYVYAMLCVCERVIIICSIMLISVMLGNVVPTICFLLCFFSLRERTDGYHAKTFLRCYVMSILAYLIVVKWSEFTCVNMQFQCTLLIIASILICIIGASIHPNMQMNEEEISASKKAARITLLLENIVILFSVWIWSDVLAISYMVSGVVLCCICLCLSKFTEGRIRLHEKRKGNFKFFGKNDESQS